MQTQPTSATTPATVRDNPALSRYELALAGGAMAFITYRRAAGIVTLLHAEVPSQFSGRGMGSAMVKGALELVRAEHSRVVPLCSFVATFIHRHPAYQDLLATHP